jgi:hypothetical protein
MNLFREIMMTVFLSGQTDCEPQTARGTNYLFFLARAALLTCAPPCFVFSTPPS